MKLRKYIVPALVAVAVLGVSTVCRAEGLADLQTEIEAQAAAVKPIVLGCIVAGFGIFALMWAGRMAKRGATTGG